MIAVVVLASWSWWSWFSLCKQRILLVSTHSPQCILYTIAQQIVEILSTIICIECGWRSNYLVAKTFVIYFPVLYLLNEKSFINGKIFAVMLMKLPYHWDKIRNVLQLIMKRYIKKKWNIEYIGRCLCARMGFLHSGKLQFEIKRLNGKAIGSMLFTNSFIFYIPKWSVIYFQNHFINVAVDWMENTRILACFRRHFDWNRIFRSLFSFILFHSDEIFAPISIVIYRFIRLQIATFDEWTTSCMNEPKRTRAKKREKNSTQL